MRGLPVAEFVGNQDLTVSQIVEDAQLALDRMAKGAKAVAPEGAVFAPEHPTAGPSVSPTREGGVSTLGIVYTYLWQQTIKYYLTHYHGATPVHQSVWTDFTESRLNGFEVKNKFVLNDQSGTPTFRIISGWSHKLFDDFGSGLNQVDSDPIPPSGGFKTYLTDTGTMYDMSSFSQWYRYPQFHFQYDVSAYHPADGHSYSWLNQVHLYDTLDKATCYDDVFPYADGCLWR